MELHTRIGGVQLQIKSRRLDSFLLVAGQFGKAVGEGVGDSELHNYRSIILRYLDGSCLF